MPSKTEPTVDYSPEYSQETEVIGSTVPALWNAAEINQQVSTAKHYPRSIENFRREAFGLVTFDEQTAAECIYAVPRDGATIEGPSARFAEIVAYSWGNCRAGAHVVDESEEFVTSQGMFYDLEKNVAITFEVKRRIVDKKGRRYTADMVGTTSTAASSIALRNAVLKGVPKALWKGLYLAARQTIAGKIETLASRRTEKINLFKAFGVTPDMIYRVLQVKGIGDITQDHLTTLTGMLTALQEGDATVEQMFAAEGPDQNVADKSKASLEALKAKYKRAPAPQAAAPQQPESPAPPAENLDAEPPPETEAVSVREAAAAAQAKVDAKRKARQEKHPDMTPVGLAMDGKW